MGKIGKMFEAVQKFGKQHDRAILTGTAVFGLIGTGILMFQAGRKVDRILKERKPQMEEAKKEGKKAQDAVLKDTVIDVSKAVAPAVLSTVATGACIIGSHSASSKKIALLSAAYSGAESMIKDLNKTLTDELGEKKTQRLKDTVAKNIVQKETANGIGDNVIITGNGDVLCMDVFTGTMFRSNAQKIDRAINAISHQVMNEMYADLNDFYYLLDIPNKPVGDAFGWSTDDLIDGSVPITRTAVLTAQNEPCLAIEYDPPKTTWGRR